MLPKAEASLEFNLELELSFKLKVEMRATANKSLLYLAKFWHTAQVGHAKGERSGSYFFLLIRLIGIWNWDELVNEISNPLIENMVICLDPPPTPEHTRLQVGQGGHFESLA